MVLSASSKETPAAAQAVHYTGVVKDKTTGKPIEGATVTVRRSVNIDPKTRGNRVLNETHHPTDAQGKYHFTIPPQQVAEPRLYIELDVSHPNYAPKAGFGYSFAMIRKNEQMGGRPFFENIELDPGEPITGRVETPEGQPAAGVQVLSYSVAGNGGGKDFGSFGYANTDENGRFRTVVATPGDAVFWLLPEKYAPSTHVVHRKRGDLGIFGLQRGIVLRGRVLDASGKPLANINVSADKARSPDDDEFFQQHPVADHIRRSARTNAKGEFTMAPLPPATYQVKPEEQGEYKVGDHNYRPEPLPAVFQPTSVTLKEGENPDPVEIQAIPHVTIAAQYVDGKGKARSGHPVMIFGQFGGNRFWFAEGPIDANGTIEALAPLGLQNTKVQLSTNEHSSLRYRLTAAGPLENSREISLGTLKNDVRGILIYRYEAPIVLIKVTTKDGSRPKKVAVTGDYAAARSPRDGKAIVARGLSSDVYFEQQEDGRFRTEQMLPDEEVTFTAHAEGYEERSEKVKLPEGGKKEITIVLEKKK